MGKIGYLDFLVPDWRLRHSSIPVEPLHAGLPEDPQLCS
jgi:hypothetical protein